MTIIDLVYELIFKFVPMKPQEIADLKAEAKADERDWTDKHENALIRWYVKNGKTWQARTICAVAYIPLVKMIQDWIAPKADDQDDD